MPTFVPREPEQLSLFAMVDGSAAACPEPAAVRTVVVPVAVETAASTPVPSPSRKMPPLLKQRLRDICAEPGFVALAQELTQACDEMNLVRVFDALRIHSFSLGQHETIYRVGADNAFGCWRCVPGGGYRFRIEDWDVRDSTTLFVTSCSYGRDQLRRHSFRLNIHYVSTEFAQAVLVPLDVVIAEQNGHFNYERTGQVESMELGRPQLPSKVLDNVFFSQTDDKLREIVIEKTPWITEWLIDNWLYDIKLYLSAPWLETLSKAGFKVITDRFLNRGQFTSTSEKEDFNRLCGPGCRPKDIFKCSKTLYTVLRDEPNLQTWDVFRRLEKKEQITGDAILIAYRMNLRPRQLELLNSILGCKHGGRPVFSMTSLMNYLNRLDMYEAIPSVVALQLLNDYLHMCRQLEIKPRIDGDSLKREHDIAARLIRARRNQQAKRGMEERAERERQEIEEGNSKLSRAAYRENVFFIRPITDYDDLLDEARQQDNCVASYAERIARGESRIFTLRETAHPERSLVTIELSPDCRTIRQKSLAHNQQIRNKAINDFIERWHRQLNAA